MEEKGRELIFLPRPTTHNDIQIEWLLQSSSYFAVLGSVLGVRIWVDVL